MISFLNPAKLISRDVSIRQLTEADASALSDMHALSFDPPWGTEDMLGLLSQDSVFGFMAVETGPLVKSRRLGFVLVRRLVDESEILTIAVSPRARGRGVGHQLMSQTLRTLYSERIDRLILEVDENNASALHLYRKLGFSQIGERKGYYSNAARQEGTTGSTALVMSCNVR